MQQAKSGNGKSPLFERVMMRCRRESCRRWISVAPNDSRLCPNCAVDGVESFLEAVDHDAHMASLPQSTNDPADVAKLAEQSKPKKP